MICCVNFRYSKLVTLVNVSRLLLASPCLAISYSGLQVPVQMGYWNIS